MLLNYLYLQQQDKLVPAINLLYGGYKKLFLQQPLFFPLLNSFYRSFTLSMTMIFFLLFLKYVYY